MQTSASDQLLVSGQRLLLCLLLLCWAPLLQASETGVLYPQTQAAYQRVYDNIIAGIDEQTGRQSERFRLHEETGPGELQQWLEDEGIDRLVILGDRGVSWIPAETAMPIVVGGSLLQPGSSPYPGISLHPDPQLLFAGVQLLAPRIEAIHVVYNPAVNSRVITEAAAAARAAGLQLFAHPVSDLREAAARYRLVQGSMHSQTDALWLPLGGPSREKSILQSILETAWNEDQIIISSNLGDVRRGALFALYPDNRSMGRDLANLLATEADKGDAGRHLLASVKQAINLRTAEHLGLRLSREALNAYEFVYPPE